MRASKRLTVLVLFFLLVSVRIYAIVIEHTPIIKAKTGELVDIKASVVGNSWKGKMNVFIKTDLSSDYVKYKMKREGNEFVYTFKVPEGIHFFYYYIEYQNGKIVDSGSDLRPYTVNVRNFSYKVLLLDPDNNSTLNDKRVLITISLFNAVKDSIKNLEVRIDKREFKKVRNPNKVLYVYETGNLSNGKHEVSLYVNNEKIVSHIFFIKRKGRLHASGYTTNRFSYSRFSGDRLVYSHQDTTTFNGYSNTRIGVYFGRYGIFAGYGLRLHNFYRNIFYGGANGGNWSINFGDYSSEVVPNFINPVLFRGVSASIGDFYIFHGSRDNAKEGIVSGTDTTFGIYREVSTGVVFNGSFLKVGGLYNRDDTNSIRVGISPMENLVLDFSLNIPIKIVRLYSYNSASITTLNSALSDSVFDYKIGFFYLNPSTIPLNFSDFPFLSSVLGVEVNAETDRFKFEYFRRGNGYINMLFDRSNDFEKGFKLYNGFYHGGYILTTYFEFLYPENQDIKNMNIYLSKSLSNGYVFTNFIYNGSKAYYFSTLSQNNKNYYLTIGNHFQTLNYGSVNTIVSFSKYEDKINNGTDDFVSSLNVFGELPPLAGVVLSPALSFAISRGDGFQYGISVNSVYGLSRFSLKNSLGYFNLQNSIYAVGVLGVSYRLNSFQPSWGLYYRRNFTPGNGYGLFKTYLTLSYAF